jgi:hypothetical protein
MEASPKRNFVQQCEWAEWRLNFEERMRRGRPFPLWLTENSGQRVSQTRPLQGRGLGGGSLSAGEKNTGFLSEGRKIRVFWFDLV